VASSAAHGNPLPSAFAVVIMSGVTPYIFAANGWPTRPIPHCTSSKISTVPVSSQRRRSASRNSLPRSTAPASPCTGSTMTAAVLSVTNPGIASILPRGMKLTSNGVRG